MAVRLDPWQNIVGVGWASGRQDYLFMNATWDGNTSISEISQTTKAAIVSTHSVIFRNSSPLDDFYRVAIYERTGSSPVGSFGESHFKGVDDSTPAGFFNHVHFTKDMRELAGDVIYYSARVEKVFASVEEQVEATISGTLELTAVFGIPSNFAAAALTFSKAPYFDPLVPGRQAIVGWKYEGASELVTTVSIPWAHFYGDPVAGGIDGDPSNDINRVFYVNVAVDFNARTIGAPFFSWP
jgi:hypothetical protein